MILLDYRGFVIAQIYGYSNYLRNAEFDEHVFTQSILKSIGLINQKFSKKYGELVICCDCRSKEYWRKEVFPEYKANRTSKQLDKTFRDKETAEIMHKLPNKIARIIKQNFPIRVLTVDRAEADDIIGALVYANRSDKHLVVSRDQDFLQLQRFNVEQYDWMHKKFIRSENPIAELKEKILKGDRGDGIPNILSPKDCLVTGVKQTVLSKKKREYFTALEEIEEGTVRDRYDLNEQMIDLSKTPIDICEEIIRMYNEYERPKSGLLMNNLMKLRYAQLIDQVNLFKIVENVNDSII